MKSPLPIKFFACTWQSAQDEVRRRRACDWWIYDWPYVDHQWLFGDGVFSPLARRYYDQIDGDLFYAVRQVYIQCESRHYAPQPEPKPGLRLTVSSRLDRGAVTHGGSAEPSGIEARLSVPFKNGANSSPTSCPMLRRELFSNPVGFDCTIHGPWNNNIRWEWRDRRPVPSAPYFDLYGRALDFYGNDVPAFLGSLHLVFHRVADLRVRFKPRPIPASAAGRVDPTQPLDYKVIDGTGYFGFAAVIEVTHLESGQIWYQSIHGANHSPGQMNTYSFWPRAWDQMSANADGVIRHYNVSLSYTLNTINPASIGLPTVGTYRMRYILLAYGYDTYDRYVRSDALGLSGDTRMSSKPIRLSHMPSLISYTPGLTSGIIPPFEVTYTCSPVLRDGIEFDAVFDLKNLTTFRFVIKVGNHFDFAVGLVVQAVEWQAWVRLEPGETKYLAGCASISTYRDTSHTHPLQGYDHYSAYFNLFLTAPDNPETTPANMPAKKATQRWHWDLSGWGPQYEPRWGAIKKYAPDGSYDYDFLLQQDSVIKRVDRSITKPSYQPLIDPATYFVTGYQTSYFVSPWHKRPWPDSSLDVVPISVNGEERTWNGSEYVWVPVETSILLTRAMMQQVAAQLGVTEYVVIDGDDMRWFVPGPTYPETFSNVLWIDRFYTLSGALIDDAAMRSAFQTVIDNNAASWPYYRNIVVHPAVRFGSFLGYGSLEVGDCLLGPTGDMVEVGSLADLGSVSTRFLYRIRPEFQ